MEQYPILLYLSNVTKTNYFDTDNHLVAAHRAVFDVYILGSYNHCSLNWSYSVDSTPITCSTMPVAFSSIVSWCETHGDVHRMKRDSGFQDFRMSRTIRDRRYEIRQTFILHTMWSVGASLPETGCRPIMHVYLLPSVRCYANSSGERKCLPSVLRFMNTDFIGNPSPL